MGTETEELPAKHRKPGIECRQRVDSWTDNESNLDDDVFSDEEESKTGGISERLGLLHAIYQEDYDNFVRLLDSGLDPNTCDCDGNPLLHIVIENGCYDMMEYLLCTESCDINKENRFHQTPLIIAVIMDDLPVLKRLVKAGVKLDILDSTGKTALLIALQDSRVAIAKYLIKHGSDVNIVDRLGQSALYIIIETMDLKCVKTVKKLLKAGYDITKDTKWMKEEGLDVDVVKSGNLISKLTRKISSKLHILKTKQTFTSSSDNGATGKRTRVLKIYD